MERRLEEGQALAIPKKRPPRRRRQQLELEDGRQAMALCDEAQRPVDYVSLVKQTQALAGGSEDPLEELRRRIKRTRGKMDVQKQVMDGFIKDVREMNAIHRSFSSTELSPPSTPTPALTAGASQPRLTAGPARPSSASNSANARAIMLRSDSTAQRRLGESRSTPALMAAAAGSLAHQAAPLALPQRRAPPGAPCSDLQKAISGAAAARQRAVASSAVAATGGGMSRLSRQGRSSPLVA